MTFLPVIARELRTAARRTFTYSLRMVGVAALLAVCVWLTAVRDIDWSGGGVIFAYLHFTLFLAIWVLVPLLTADCLSRERREGTLPLLFLTPLKPRGIVLAKGLAHGLTAFTLWLAVLPVLALPFIAGGVGWREAVLSVLANFSSICLAMGAGLVASANSKGLMRALVCAIFLGFLFCLGLILGAGLIVNAVMAHLTPPPGQLEVLDPELCFQAGAFLMLDWDNGWQDNPMSGTGSFLSGGGSYGWLLIAQAAVTALSVLALLLLFLYAASSVKRVWREPPPSARVIWLNQKFCTPVFFQRFFRRWLRWELERNPIGWLERRTWSGRLIMWSWFAIVVSIYTSLLTNLGLYQHSFHGLQSFLAWLLVGNLAVSAAGSFRRERENGVLELLLVAPLREGQILGGRVRGLWGQFLPAMVLVLGIWLYCARFLDYRPHATSEWPAILFFAGTFLCLPVIGLYFSLAKRGFMSAFFWTLSVGIALPGFCAQSPEFMSFVLSALGRPGDPWGDVRTAWLFNPVQALLAALLAWRLHSDLKQRRFAMP